MATFGGVRVSDTDALVLRGIITAPTPVWRPTEFRTEAPDEMVDALLWAIAELAGEHHETRDEHFEELHPRGPGGKFRTIADRVLHALSQHVAKNGTGDPLKDFNREQLRRVAKARGIDLPRGASIEHIKAALLEHVAGKVGGKVDVTPSKAEAKAFEAKVAAAVEGKAALDSPTASLITGRGLTSAQKDALSRYQNGSYRMNDWLRTHANDPAPNVPARIAHMDAALANSPLQRDTVLYRGVSGSEKIFGPAAGWPDSFVGKEWTDPGFSSTTAKGSDVAGSYGGDHRLSLRMVAPKGTGAVTIAGWNADGEVLLPRGLRFRVVADRTNVDIRGPFGKEIKNRVLDVEVVPGKPDVPAKKAVEKAAHDLTGAHGLSTDLVDRLVEHMHGGG